MPSPKKTSKARAKAAPRKATKKKGPNATAASAPKTARKAVAATARRRPVPAPASPTSATGPEYAAMVKIVLAAVPATGPGVSRNQVMDAAREAATNRTFPGDTHRMWAKQVLLDLAANGAIVSTKGTPEKWRRP